MNHDAEGHPVAATDRPAGLFQAFYSMLLQAFLLDYVEDSHADSA